MTIVITKVSSPEADDRFYTTGSAVRQPGWKVLDVVVKKRDLAEPEMSDLPAGLLQGSLRPVLEVGIEEKKTRPPKRLTEASLLAAMESAGRTLEDEELGPFACVTMP